MEIEFYCPTHGVQKRIITPNRVKNPRGVRSVHCQYCRLIIGDVTLVGTRLVWPNRYYKESDFPQGDLDLPNNIHL